jgi:hypothetical protein
VAPETPWYAENGVAAVSEENSRAAVVLPGVDVVAGAAAAADDPSSATPATAEPAARR